jgi:sugar-specific transcriptional regulator TrmB
MFVLNGQATKGAEILRKYGLTRYESRAYFSLLLLGETDAGTLSRKSGVPQTKVYWILDNLIDKRLVEITQRFPKRVVALPFEMYLAGYMQEKQKEIQALVESRKQLREVLYKLQPLALKHSDKIQIFEPSRKRGLNSSPAS